MIPFTPIDKDRTIVETFDALGFIPFFFNTDDERSAQEQVNANYAHGGGWRTFKGHELINHDPPTIKYPGDLPLKAIAKATLRDETIYVFPNSWVMIMQANGSWEIARLD